MMIHIHTQTSKKKYFWIYLQCIINLYTFILHGIQLYTIILVPIASVPFGPKSISRFFD